MVWLPQEDGYGLNVWLCPDCEYKRRKPEAKPAAAMPWERQPAPRQTETLFPHG